LLQLFADGVNDTDDKISASLNLPPVSLAPVDYLPLVSYAASGVGTGKIDTGSSVHTGDAP
jgi:hypothetical protein